MANNDWVNQNFARVDFRTDEFDKMLYQKGAKIVWEKSILCSCLDDNTGSPDYTCTACKGKGYDYFDPKEIRAVVSGISGNKDQTPIGLLDVGTAFLTARVQDDIGFRDRLTFVDFRTPYSQVLTYDSMATTGIKLRYQCEEIVSVQILGTTIPDTSYTLSADKQHLVFDTGVFNDMDRFSVLYRIRPSYIVIDIPHELRGSPVQFGLPTEQFMILPKQFMIKREDLLPLQRGQVI